MHAPIHRYLTRLTGDTHAAAELTQETFIDAYNALPRLADDSNLSAWLFRIATNLARKQYRRRTLVDWVALDSFAAHPSNLEDQVIEQALVGRALEQLSIDYKACLLLHVWAGLTSAEIAQVVGKSEDAVRMTLVRARRQFRAFYDAGNVDA